MSKLLEALQSQIDKTVQKAIRKQVLPLKKTINEMRRQMARLAKGGAVAAKATARMAVPKSAEEGETGPQTRLSAGLIKKFRKRMGISQTDLAKLLHVSQPAVASWEQGRAKPRSAVRNALISLRDMPRPALQEMLGHEGGTEVKKRRGRPPKTQAPQ